MKESSSGILKLSKADPQCVYFLICTELNLVLSLWCFQAKTEHIVSSGVGVKSGGFRGKGNSFPLPLGKCQLLQWVFSDLHQLCSFEKKRAGGHHKGGWDLACTIHLLPQPFHPVVPHSLPCFTPRPALSPAFLALVAVGKSGNRQISCISALIDHQWSTPNTVGGRFVKAEASSPILDSHDLQRIGLTRTHTCTNAHTQTQANLKTLSLVK